LFKAVLFDYDGVIVYTMPYHIKAWQAQFNEFGIEIKPHDVLLREGSIAINIGRNIFQKNGIDISQSELEQFVREKQERYRAITEAGVAELVPEFLDFLNTEGIRIGLVTGTDIPNVINVISSELFGKFEIAITSEKVSRGKPHPEPYLKGAEALGVDPGDCLVVENAPLGIESGKNAGMTVAALETTLQREYLPGADVYFNDIADLYQNWQKLIAERQAVL
jgi:beta-phosphoglucomutase